MLEKEIMNDAELARKLFTYEPSTGVLRWRADRVVELRNHSQVKAKGGVEAGWSTSDGYRQVRFRGRKRKATSIIWLIVTGKPPKGQVDHVNGMKNDDRWENLRLASASQNRCNVSKYKNNTSGHKGVSWSEQKGKWRATIRIHNKQKHLGFFDDPKVAAQAYAAAVPVYHGEFGRVA